jgi:PAS domain S-box-containing protein
MPSRGRTLVWCLACGAGVGLAVAAGVALYALFPPALNLPVVYLFLLPVLLLAAVALIGVAAVRREAVLRAELDARDARLRAAAGQAAELARLRGREERLRLIGDTLPGGAMYQAIIRPDHTPLFTHVSAGIEPLLGITPAQAITDPDVLIRLIHPDDLPRVRAAQLVSHRDLVPFDVEFRSFTAAGDVKWLHCRAMSRRLPDGSVERNGVLLDVTDRKRAEESLRASEQLFRVIFETTAAGITLTDAAGRFVSCNPAFAAMVGRTVADVYRLTPADLTHPDDWAAQGPLFAETVAGTRDHYDFPKRYVRPDGSVVWTELSVTVLRGPDGRFEYGLGVSIDVTARRRLEEQLRDARQLEAVGRLAGGVAHDFNNLLTGVLGGLGLVRLPADDPNRPLVAAAEQAAARAAELTRRLLGYARRNQLVPAPVSPREALGALAAALRRKLDPRTRVEVRVDPGCGPVLADAALLHSALSSLCANAREAMPDGGTITLSAEVVEVAPGAAGRGCPDARAGEFVRLGVSDTGHGMTPDVMARVFDPFFTTKGPDKGTGLGLPMVQGIAKQHRGWVECTSEPGAGTRIDLYLPPAEDGLPAGAVHYPGAASASAVTPFPTARPAPRPAPALAPAQSPADVTILLVDDEEMIRTLGRMILEAAGYRVLTAADGAEAVEVFAAEHARISLVILDVTMPRMSGREAFRHMVGVCPGVRVLFSTGYSAEDIAELGGALGLLSKPYRPHELLAAVRDALAAEPVGPAARHEQV